MKTTKKDAKPSTQETAHTAPTQAPPRDPNVNDDLVRAMSQMKPEQFRATLREIQLVAREAREAFRATLPKKGDAFRVRGGDRNKNVLGQKGQWLEDVRQTCGHAALETGEIRYLNAGDCEPIS